MSPFMVASARWCDLVIFGDRTGRWLLCSHSTLHCLNNTVGLTHLFDTAPGIDHNYRRWYQQGYRNPVDHRLRRVAFLRKSHSTPEPRSMGPVKPSCNARSGVTTVPIPDCALLPYAVVGEQVFRIRLRIVWEAAA